MVGSVAVILLVTNSFFTTSVDGFGYGGHSSGYEGGEGSGTACIVKVGPPASSASLCKLCFFQIFCLLCRDRTVRATIASVRKAASTAVATITREDMVSLVKSFHEKQKHVEIAGIKHEEIQNTRVDMVSLKKIFP